MSTNVISISAVLDTSSTDSTSGTNNAAPPSSSTDVAIFEDRPLVKAAISGWEEHVAFYLGRNHDNNFVNQQDKAGRTALYVAAATGRLTIVKTLLEKRPNVDLQAVDGSTALAAAILEEHLEIAAMLFEHGSSVILRSQYNQTPLSLAIRTPNFENLSERMWKSLSLDSTLRMQHYGFMTLFESCIEARESENHKYGFLGGIIDWLSELDREAISRGGRILKNWQNVKLPQMLYLALGDGRVGKESAMEERKKRGMIPIPSAEFRKNYMVKEYLAHGGFSSAWRAVDLNTAEIVVAKFIMRRLEPRELRNASREARIMRELNHKNIMSCIRYMESESRPVYITELADGGDLSDWQQQEYPRRYVDEPTAKMIFRQIMEGVEHMHSRKIIHEDLKHDNILCLKSGSEWIFKIADFGNSSHIPADGKVDRVFGTITHLAPEIINKNPETGRSILGTLCDVWAAGVILYKILTSKSAFDSERSDSNQESHRDRKEEVRQAIKEGDLHFDDSGRWGHVSDSALHLVARMLDPDPLYRPTSSEILAHPWLTGDAVKQANLDFTNLRVPHSERMPLKIGRHPEWVSRQAVPVVAPPVQMQDSAEHIPVPADTSVELPPARNGVYMHPNFLRTGLPGGQSLNLVPGPSGNQQARRRQHSVQSGNQMDWNQAQASNRRQRAHGPGNQMNAAPVYAPTMQGSSRTLATGLNIHQPTLRDQASVNVHPRGRQPGNHQPAPGPTNQPPAMLFQNTSGRQLHNHQSATSLMTQLAAMTSPEMIEPQINNHQPVTAHMNQPFAMPTQTISGPQLNNRQSTPGPTNQPPAMLFQNASERQLHNRQPTTSLMTQLAAVTSQEMIEPQLNNRQPAPGPVNQQSAMTSQAPINGAGLPYIPPHRQGGPVSAVSVGNMMNQTSRANGQASSSHQVDLPRGPAGRGQPQRIVPSHINRDWRRRDQAPEDNKRKRNGISPPEGPRKDHGQGF